MRAQEAGRGMGMIISEGATPRKLNYSADGRRRRRWLWIVAACVAVGVLVPFYPEIKQRATVAYYAHRCRAYEMPPDKTFTEHAPVTGDVGTPLAKLGPLIGASTISPALGESLAFLHERRTAAGSAYIVAIYIDTPYMVNDDSPEFWCEIFTDGVWQRPKSVARYGQDAPLPGSPAAASAANTSAAKKSTSVKSFLAALFSKPRIGASSLVLHAGQPDPNDPALATFRYESDWGSGYVHARLYDPNERPYLTKPDVEFTAVADPPELRAGGGRVAH